MEKFHAIVWFDKWLARADELESSGQILQFDQVLCYTYLEIIQPRQANCRSEKLFTISLQK